MPGESLLIIREGATVGQAGSGSADNESAAAHADSLGVEEWIDDLIYSAEWAHGPDDMREYFEARVAATQDLLGIRRTVSSDPERDVARRAFLSVIEATARVQASDMSPFDGFLECPMEFAQFTEPVRERFAQLREERERLLRETVRSGVAHYFPDALGRRVRWEQLEARGVSPQPPRDPLQVDLDDWMW